MTIRRAAVTLLALLVPPALLTAQTAAATATATITTTVTTSSPEKTDAEYLALGRKLTEWFFSAEADSLLAHMAPADREGAGGVDGVNRAVSEFIVRAGTEQEVVEEKMTRRRGHPQYWREGRYSDVSEDTIIIRWVFDEQGQVIGIGLGPKRQTPAPD
jgi:hypothetical protein